MKKFLITVIILLSLVILAEVGFLVYRDYAADNTVPTSAPTTQATDVTTVPTTAATEAPTTVPTTAPTEAPTTVPTTVATEVPTTAPVETTVPPTTEAPTEAPTEPETAKNTSYLLSFAGNCTLGTTLSDAKNSAGFHSIIGDDYGHPFRNVQEIFSKDDFTMVNLEGVLADGGDPIGKTYTFIGPADYAKILTEGSVEAVSLANDHTGDFGTAGYNATKASLEAQNVSYVEADNTLLYTTESGLKVGVYAVNFKLSNWDMQQDIKKLKNNGAEVIVVFFHWGEEKAYEPSLTQINYGHTAIDAGADIVIGTNPHVLQKVEGYKHGIICYSLGNFSYGGAKWPKDTDTVIIQLEVIRDEQGKVSLGELYTIPCVMTSSTSQNNYQPTILESDNWQFKQILRKLTDPNANTDTDSVGSTEKPTTTPTAAPTEEPTQAPTEAPTEAPTVAPTEAPGPDYDNNDVPDLNDPEA